MELYFFEQQGLNGLTNVHGLSYLREFFVLLLNIPYYEDNGALKRCPRSCCFRSFRRKLMVKIILNFG
uniref:Uncharacterized protein n=1 Tax=Trichuris muris TaxID=70415 RepID=A0A5S6QJE5_TRIMR